MCLGELARVVRLDATGAAEVTVRDRRATVSLMVLDEPVAVGDWLLVHAGYALERLTDAAATEAARIRAAAEPDQEAP
jgi:hydrogenase expression/formation protein HypC